MDYYIIKINFDSSKNQENKTIASFSNLNLATIEYHQYAKDCRSNSKIAWYHVEVINKYGKHEIIETWERPAPPSV